LDDLVETTTVVGLWLPSQGPIDKISSTRRWRRSTTRLTQPYPSQLSQARPSQSTVSP